MSSGLAQQQSRLKDLISKGREQGYLTYAEVNDHLNARLGTTSDPRLKIGNAALPLACTLTAGNSLAGKAILSLVNIEEDRATRTPTNRVKTATEAQFKNPPLLLNFYVLFSINKPQYDDCLKWLVHIITLFQYQKRFSPVTHPHLDSRIEELSIELYTLNFEQVSHLWSTLGGKYLPSALYKVRQVSVDAGIVTGTTGLIKEIVLEERAMPLRTEVNT